MLYREESQYKRVQNRADTAPPPHTEEFVECLQKALKIMETKYPAIHEKQ